MSANLKSLIGRLNDTCRNALEGAAGLCLSRTNYEVEVEHRSSSSARSPTRTSHGSSATTRSTRRGCAKDLSASLDRFKTGNARTPLSRRASRS